MTPPPRATATLLATRCAIAALFLAAASCREDRSVDEAAAALADERAEERAMAGWDLHRLGAAAQPALDALAKASRDPEPSVRVAAVAALAGLGPEAVPPLIAALRSDPAGVCKYAIDGLTRHAAAAPEAVPLLIELLRDPVPVRCGYVLDGLVAFGAASVDPVLAEAGRTAAEDLTGLVYVLSKIGAPAVPALLRATASKDRSRRLLAVRSLREIAPDDAAAGAAYVLLLDDPEREVRTEAALALAERGPSYSPGFPALAARLEDEAVRGGANLGFSNHPEAALRVLIPLVTTPDPATDPEAHRRLYAVGALGGLRGGARPAASVLAAAAARDPASGIRLEALRALREVEAGPEVLPDVVAALGDASDTIADEARSYLRARAAAARPALEKAAAGPEPLAARAKALLAETTR